MPLWGSIEEEQRSKAESAKYSGGKIVKNRQQETAASPRELRSNIKNACFSAIDQQTTARIPARAASGINLAKGAATNINKAKNSTVAFPPPAPWSRHLYSRQCELLCRLHKIRQTRRSRYLPAFAPRARRWSDGELRSWSRRPWPTRKEPRERLPQSNRRT